MFSMIYAFIRHLIGPLRFPRKLARTLIFSGGGLQQNGPILLQPEPKETVAVKIDKIPPEDRLFDHAGQRKYLCGTEGRRFLDAANREEGAARLFCHLLFYTGCRISEALALTPRRLDAEAQGVVFRTLKRRRLAYRAIPIPAVLLGELLTLAKNRQPDELLWPWSRQKGWRIIKRIMAAAAISGPQAMPKGLRHQFGVDAIGCNVPETTLQKWMGHAKVKNTHIYTVAVGLEERSFAQRMWRVR